MEQQNNKRAKAGVGVNAKRPRLQCIRPSSRACPIPLCHGCNCVLVYREPIHGNCFAFQV